MLRLICWSHSCRYGFVTFRTVEEADKVRAMVSPFAFPGKRMYRNIEAGRGKLRKQGKQTKKRVAPRNMKRSNNGKLTYLHEFFFKKKRGKDTATNGSPIFGKMVIRSLRKEKKKNVSTWGWCGYVERRKELADVSSVSPSSEQRRSSDEGLTLSQQTLYGVQHIHINLTLIHVHSSFYRYADAD